MSVCFNTSYSCNKIDNYQHAWRNGKDSLGLSITALDNRQSLKRNRTEAILNYATQFYGI